MLGHSAQQLEGAHIRIEDMKAHQSFLEMRSNAIASDYEEL